VNEFAQKPLILSSKASLERGLLAMQFDPRTSLILDASCSKN